MRKFFTKTLAVLLACIFVLSGFSFSIFASEADATVDLGDKLVSANVTLTGGISLQLYFTDVENVAYYKVDVDGVTSETAISDMPTDEKNGKTRYMLEVYLAAAQQTMDVTVTPYSADGTAGMAHTYSVKDYVDGAIAEGASYETIEALKSMLNYGSMAQLAFDYNTSELANVDLYLGATNPINNMSASDLYGVKAHEHTASNADQLDFVKVNAYLKDTVALRFYFECSGDASAVSATVEGTESEVFSDDDGYYVLIQNIPATKFNHQYTVAITDGDNTAELKYSVLNYVESFVKDEENTKADINTAYAMFLYYARMSEYVYGEVSGMPNNCDHKRSYVDIQLGKAEICSVCGENLSPDDIIKNANDLANGVTSYFGTQDGKIDGRRDHYVVENAHLNAYMALTSEEKQLVTITDKNGAAYVEDTMDVFVTVGGTRYYSSNSTKSATANLYRYGYYYYDVHAYGQNFTEDGKSTEPVAGKNYPLSYLTKAHDLTASASSGKLVCKITSTTDPYVYASTGNTAYNTGTYNAIQITMTTESTSSVQLRYIESTYASFDDVNMLVFETIADSEQHTYTIYFNEKVNVYRLRLDFNGNVGETVTISSIRFVTIDVGNAPNLLLDRGFHTYTDKMHQALSLVAPYSDVENIDEVGMVTKIPTNKVGKLNVNGVEYTSISNTISNVEYAGFYITGVGVFGYILPTGDYGGSIKLTVEDGYYVITQTIVPEGNKISQQPNVKTNAEMLEYAANDPTIGTSLNIYNSPTQFYFGQRIYTDKNADFSEFLEQAYIERNPLTSGNIHIDTEKSPTATFDGYDPIRGIYAFTIPENIGFEDGYYRAQNFHGTLSFSVKGDDHDRNIYVLAYSYGACVEGGAVLDKNDQLLPIPTEVAKNFGHEFEEPIWLWGDVKYSETRIPVYVKAGETEELSVLQLYMNWGRYPLKQISSIQFFAPYYHLSTGVTESNCIASYYVHGKDLQTLPDHRGASSCWWADNEAESGDPQHDNGGFHYFLQYTNEAGKKITSEDVLNIIHSSGNTYADIDMTYISDDNKLKVTYTHVEMPQLDENRAYYTMQYEILEDLTISDFSKNFSFYSVTGYGDYTGMGYLDSSNQSVNVENIDSFDETKTYVLGDLFPYFDLYGIKTNSGTTKTNVSFLINNWSTTNETLSDSSFIVSITPNGLASLTLNAGQVTLKKGETITINAIIMPWWNQAYLDGNDPIPDTNVRRVRENSLIAPIGATAGANSVVVQNATIPTVKTTNGLDATLTLGHSNTNAVELDGNINVSFRVDGFDMLATPKLYEFVNGAWTLVEISSAGQYDRTGNAHEYDGYAVYYNSDGTYSYSFVTTLSGETQRTFKVVVDDTYVEWDEVYGNNVFNAHAIYKYAMKGSGFGTLTLNDNNSYLTLRNGGTADPATAGFKMLNVGSANYLVIKYRVPKGNQTQTMQFFMTTGETISGKGDNFTISSNVIQADNEWQVMVIDLAAIANERGMTEMVKNARNSYTIQYFRFDPFTVANSNYYYVEYIAFCEKLEDAVAMNSGMDMSKISYVYSTSKYDPISDRLDYVEDHDDMNVFFDEHDIVGQSKDGYGDAPTSQLSMTVNGDKTVTFTRAATDAEAFVCFKTNSESSAIVETGRYLVVKYKTSAANLKLGNIFASTVNYTGTAGDNITVSLKNDGQWHTAVFDLSKISTVNAASNGKYYVNYVRIDFASNLALNETIQYAYVGLCDDLEKVLSSSDEFIEYGGQYRNNIDTVYADGRNDINYKGESAIRATTVQYYGWLAVNGFSAEGMSYVVTDANGEKTIVSIPESNDGSLTSRYFLGEQGIQDAVNAVAGTVGYRINFTADLSKWSGQTVKLSIVEHVLGGLASETYSITVTVP